MSSLPPPVVKKDDNEPERSKQQQQPLLSLDFDEWDPEKDDAMFDLASPAKSAQSSLVTDPLLCQLHGFITQVEAQLRMHALVRQRMRWPKNKEKQPRVADGPMLDWTSASVHALAKDSTDIEVVRLLQHGVYPVVRTLFWIQRNSRCATEVHLMRDIVASRRWRRTFCYVMQELMRMPPLAPIEQHEALVKWVNAQWDLSQQNVLDVVDFGPFSPTPSATPLPTPGGDMVTRLVREMTKTPDLNAEQVTALAVLYLPSEAHRARVWSILHAQFVVARLIANSLRAVTTTPDSIRSTRASIEWLRDFVVRGCKCSS